VQNKQTFEVEKKLRLAYKQTLFITHSMSTAY